MAFGRVVAVLACAIASVEALKLLSATDTRDDPVCNCACCNVQAETATPKWGHVVDGHQLYGCGPIFASQLFSNRGFAECTPQFGREGAFCRDTSLNMEPNVGVTEFCFNSCTPSTMTPKGYGQECLPVTPAIIAKAPLAPAVATTTTIPFNSRILPLFRSTPRSGGVPTSASAPVEPSTVEGTPSLAGQNPHAASSTPQPVAAANATASTRRRVWVDLPPPCACVEVMHPVVGTVHATCLDHLGDDPRTWCFVPLEAECEPASRRDADFPEFARWYCNASAESIANDAAPVHGAFEADSGGAVADVTDDMVTGLEEATGAAAELTTTTSRPLGWELAEENRYCAGSQDLGPVTSTTDCQERASANLRCGPAIHSNGALCFCVRSGHACESSVSADGNNIYMFRPDSGVIGADVSAAVSSSPEARAGVQAAAVGTSALDAVAADVFSR